MASDDESGAEFQDIHSACKAWGWWRARQNQAARAGRIDRVFTGPDPGSYFRVCRYCFNRNRVFDETERKELSHRKELRYDEGADQVLEVLEVCFACDGRGGEHLRSPVADPATIPGPSVMYVKAPPPEVIKTIEEAVESFDVERRAVLVSRYVMFFKGDATERLRYANEMIEACGSPRIGMPYYRKLLTDSKRRLSEITGIPLEQPNV